MSGVSGRPFKVWSGDRKVKKSLVVSSLSELLVKGCQKLGISEPNSDHIQVVLEVDGTEVDDEDYFSFLPSDTTFLLLMPSDKWKPCGVEDLGKDETDFAGHSSLTAEHARHLAQSLKQDISRIITFSDHDLNMVLSVSVGELAQEMGESEGYARALQDACQRHLDERQQTAEALELLRLYHKARTESPYVDVEPTAGGVKRPHSPDHCENH